MPRIKNHNFVALAIFLSCFVTLQSFAQQPVTVKYFDSSWKSTSKETAFYFTEMVKEDTLYRGTTYWMKSKKLNKKATFVDTGLSRPIGLSVSYYENGQTSDSEYNATISSITYAYHYYPDGKLAAHYKYDPKTKKESTEAFDQKGNPIEDFVYFREASFQEGAADWINFLSENINSKVPVKKGAPVGHYQVIIRFIVDTDGKISDIRAETSLGYGMEEEAMRIIKKSPRWNPAIYLNKKLKAYRRQPLTFVVEEK